MADDVPEKPKYVFISYSSKDAAHAQAVRHFLEEARIRCWISEDNIRTGEDWDDEIADAIEGCSLMVLVVSPNSLTSTQVKNEFHMALDREKKIFPFKIREVELRRGWGLQLKRLHWIDALTEPLEQHLKKLSEDVQEYLSRKANPAEQKPLKQAAFTVSAQPEQVSEPDLGPSTVQPEPISIPSSAEGQQAADLSHELAEAAKPPESEIVAPPPEPQLQVVEPSETHPEPDVAASDPYAESVTLPPEPQIETMTPLSQPAASEAVSRTTPWQKMRSWLFVLTAVGLVVGVIFVGISLFARYRTDRLLNEAVKEPVNWRSVQTLVAQGANVNTEFHERNTLLIYAVDGKQLEVVKFLLDKGADVKAHNNFGGSALSFAIRHGDLEIAKLLVDKGADVNDTPHTGLTPLIDAATDGRLEAAKFLLDKGAHVNSKDCLGWTALMKAARHGQLEIVNLLLAKGADVNAKSEAGWTALMNAAYDGHVEIAKVLLAKGADPNVKDEDGKTALDIATKKGSTELVKLLKARGAR